MRRSQCSGTGWNHIRYLSIGTGPNSAFLGFCGSVRHSIYLSTIAASEYKCRSTTLVQGTVLPPVMRAPIGYTSRARFFPPVGRAPDRCTAPPMANAPMLSEGTPFPAAYMAPPSWPI